MPWPKHADVANWAQKAGVDLTKTVTFPSSREMFDFIETDPAALAGSVVVLESYDWLGRRGIKPGLYAALHLLHHGVGIAILETGRHFRPDGEDPAAVFDLLSGIGGVRLGPEKASRQILEGLAAGGA